MITRFRYFFVYLFIGWSKFCWAQTTDKIVFNEGVNAYREGNYAAAQERFESAATQNPQNIRALFNAGNSAFLGGDYDKAKQHFSQYANSSPSSFDRAKGFYNLGNVQLQEALQAEANPESKGQAQNLFKQAITSYKESLKFNPTDEDAKYNLTYAMKKLQQNQQNEQNQQDNKDQQKEDNQDNQKNDNQDKQDQQDKNNQDRKNDSSEKNGENDKDKQDNNQDQKDEGDGDKKEQAKPGQISREQALKDLDAVNNDERKVLQKVTGTKATKSQDAKLIKDW
jgi:Ca-activated chloride channel homolog